jgi:hypothetical protein
MSTLKGDEVVVGRWVNGDQVVGCNGDIEAGVKGEQKRGGKRAKGVSKSFALLPWLELAD